MHLTKQLPFISPTYQLRVIALLWRVVFQLKSSKLWFQAKRLFPCLHLIMHNSFGRYVWFSLFSFAHIQFSSYQLPWFLPSIVWFSLFILKREKPITWLQNWNRPDAKFASFQYILFHLQYSTYGVWCRRNIATNTDRNQVKIVNANADCMHFGSCSSFFLTSFNFIFFYFFLVLLLLLLLHFFFLNLQSKSSSEAC